MRSIEVEGATVEAALELGLAALGIERAAAEVAVLREPDPSGKSARVRVSLAGAEPERQSAATGDVSRETSPTSAADLFPGKQSVVDTLQRIISELGIRPNVQVPASAGGDGFVIEVSGDGAALLIGRHGQVVEAIEYVLNRIAGAAGSTAPRVLVDVEGYRARREQSLEEMARRVAEAVRASGRPQVLQPMSPRDRRIVHVALQDDPTVATHSEGDGPYRTLVVSPAGNRR